MKSNTARCHDLCTFFPKVQGDVRPPRVSLGFKGWYVRRSLVRAQKRLGKHQLLSLWSRSASLATIAMQSFSKGAENSCGGTAFTFTVWLQPSLLQTNPAHSTAFSKSLPSSFQHFTFI